MGFVCGLIVAGLSPPLTAQDRIPSHCIALSQTAPGIEYIHRASWAEPIPQDKVRITYIDHSMFLIQSQGGTSAMTDFTGYYGNVDFLPDVITMNNAHSSHWTSFPDPAILHVLKGWSDAGAPRDHYIDLGDMLVRNVHTSTRGREGRDTEYGNSIFVFEAAGLCIGHFGHLHHEPTPAQYAALGRMDVVMAAVDGGLTLDHDTLVRVLDRLRATVVIPMHWFGQRTLDDFLSAMQESGYRVDATGQTSRMLSLGDLPSQRTVMVLDPRFLTTQ